MLEMLPRVLPPSISERLKKVWVGTSAFLQMLLKIAPEYDYMITAEAKGIPLVHEMARLAGNQKYFLARKAPKLYMQGVFECEVRSIPTAATQHLYLDVADAERMKGKRVLIVDDVFTTGSTLSECAKVLKKARTKEIRALSFLKTDPFRQENM